MARLSKTERQQKIIAELQATPTIRALDLARSLQVSTETIRRDLEELESKGLINRTYGGASRPLSPDGDIGQREQMFVRERENIAREATRFVNHGDVIIIAGGSTALHVARRLAAEKHDLLVVTDSFAVAEVIATNSTIRVQMCPGTYNPRERCVYGADTINFLERDYANQVIIGTSGLNKGGICSADYDIGSTYSAVIRRGSEVTVVADHSKIAQTAVHTFASWSEITRLVTDQPPYDEELIGAIKLARVEVVVAQDAWGNNN